MTLLRAISLMILTSLYFTAFSQDSLRITLDEAEGQFLKNNLELLAAHYNIDAQKALVLQAKLWDNPNLLIDQGMYNPDTKKWFDLTKTGQTQLTVQQLIYIAGKRNDRIKIQKINAQISEYQFFDLLRSLRFELRSAFFSLHFLRQSLGVYERELKALSSLVDAYSNEYRKGNIAFKELARLQALQFGLENEKIDLLKQAKEKESDLMLLTGDTASKIVIPSLDVSKFDSLNISALTYSQLLDSAFVNRYDLKIADAQVQQEQTNLALQKASGVPDLHLGANWDKQGSYVRNYNSLQLSFDLPFWNHNEGNIKNAKNRIEIAKLLRNKGAIEIKNDVAKAFSQLTETDRLYQNALKNFPVQSYDALLEGITRGYQNHTISLLEFIDYYETYKSSKTEFYHLQNTRLNAIDELNLATGTNLIK